MFLVSRRSCNFLIFRVQGAGCMGRVEGGGWRVEGGGWRVEGEGCRGKGEHGQ